MTLVLALALLPVAVVALIAGLRAPVRVLLTAYALVLPFGSAVSLPLGLPAPFDTPSSVLGLIVIAGLVGHLMLVPRSAAVLLPAVPAWLLFAAYCGLTFAWSVNPSQSIDEFIVLLSLVALYTLVMLMPVEERDVARIEEALVVGGAILGVYGITLLLQTGLGEGGRLATAGGVGKGIDPNITAATLILPLAIAIGRGVRAVRAVSRLSFWSAGALIGAAIVLTGSRGGLLAAVIVLMIHAFSGRHRRRVAVVGLGLVVVAGLTVSLAPDNISRRLTRPSSSGRTDIWRTAMHKCDAYCWSGSGLGTFPTVYQDTLHSEPSARGLDRPFVAHSIWIGALIETGITGLLLLMLALGLVAKDLLRLPVDIRAAPLAGFVGVLIASTFLSTLGFKYF
ncbi:MAG: O-antigen ligase family protein, partial [Actinomycetota bacterium]